MHFESIVESPITKADVRFRHLQNCLDILSEEATTWVSMMKPLAHSLISEHYSVEEAEDDGKGDIGKLVRTMKTIIADRLKEK